jgi:hypothetical protein
LSVEPALPAPEPLPLADPEALPLDPPEVPPAPAGELELFAPDEPPAPAWLSRLQPASASASDAARMVSSFIDSSKNVVTPMEQTSGQI